MNRKILGHIFAILTISIWSSTYISTKVLLNTFTPLEILFIRFFIGIFTLFLISPKLFKWQGIREELNYALAGLSGITLYYLCDNYCLLYTSAANAGVIVATAPFFTALLMFFITKGKERFSISFIIGFIISIIGICILSFQGQKFGFNPFGDFLALLAPICWSFYAYFSSLIKKDSIITSTRRIFEYGLIFLLPVILISKPEISLEDFTLINTLNLIFLSFIASAICFLTWNYATLTLGPVKTTIYLYLSPVMTVLFSFLILSEPISWLSIIGIIFTLSGLIISEKRELNR